jgi:putative addiction module killer protein
VVRIAQRLDRLQHGNPSDHTSVGRGVLELRIPYGPGYRIYYIKRGELLVILLCGGDKSSQAADIQRAHILAEALR